MSRWCPQILFDVKTFQARLFTIERIQSIEGGGNRIVSDIYWRILLLLFLVSLCQSLFAHYKPTWVIAPIMSLPVDYNHCKWIRAFVLSKSAIVTFPNLHKRIFNFPPPFEFCALTQTGTEFEERDRNSSHYFFSSNYLPWGLLKKVQTDWLCRGLYRRKPWWCRFKRFYLSTTTKNFNQPCSVTFLSDMATSRLDGLFSPRLPFSCATVSLYRNITFIRLYPL